jgi:hypothetical protein
LNPWVAIRLLDGTGRRRYAGRGKAGLGDAGRGKAGLGDAGRGNAGFGDAG